MAEAHVLSAIQEIDREGVRSGRHSTTYDLLYKGKKYPPKLVISIAYRYATGRELEPSEFPGGEDTDAFDLLRRLGFEITPKTAVPAALSADGFARRLFNYLNGLPVGHTIQNWTFKGESDIRYSTPAGPWLHPGFLFENDSFSFIIRSVWDGGAAQDLQYLAVESNNLHRQLANVSLYQASRYTVTNGTVSIHEAFDMTVGRGKKPRKEVMEAFARFGLAGSQITAFEAAKFDGDKIIGDILRWATIREQVKLALKSNKQEPMEEETNGVGQVSKNMILFGPPGTGKTFNSLDKAVEIATGASFTHAENKPVFDRLRKEGQIAFITFHQNYSYEDFMVGLKPDAEFEHLRFKPWKGIFYEMARRARENYVASKERRAVARDFDAVFAELIKSVTEGKELEVKMKSGISYWIYNVNASTIFFRKRNGSELHTLSIDSLRELVENIRKMPSGLEPYYTPLITLIQEQANQQKGTAAEQLKNYVLIIDEINRANISRVFGELITLLEDDKRIGAPNELRITLPNGEREFAIPPNLYVIGTMNTADKSIALVDIALRRRFEFIGYYPDYSIPELDPAAATLLRHINGAIYQKKRSADYLIGHGYFLGGLPHAEVLRKKVIPLLMEYFSGKPDVVEEIFRGIDWTVSYNQDRYEWDIIQENKR